MFNIILAIHAILCIILMGLVLIQQGKGADMGAAFGGNSTTLFGAAGAADFLTKLTTRIAIAFMVSSIFLVRAYSTLETAPEAVLNPLEGSVMGGEQQAAAPVAEVAPPSGVNAESGAPAAVEVDSAPIAAAPGTSAGSKESETGGSAPVTEPAPAPAAESAAKDSAKGN